MNDRPPPDAEVVSDKRIDQLIEIADLDKAHEWAAALRELKALRAKCNAQQAFIDSLMLEYCPQDMSGEQVERWQRNQQCSPNSAGD